MTDHQWLNENLYAFLADGLDSAERERAQQHLAACADCARLLKEAKALEVYMTDLFSPARPDTRLEDRAIRRLRITPVRRPNWLRFAIAAAAVVVLGVVGTIVQAVVLNNDLRFPMAEKMIAMNNLKPLAFWRGEAQTTFTTAGSKIGAVSVEDSKESFAVRDVDPKMQEFDKDIQYSTERIADVSVPGGRSANEMIGIQENLKGRIDPNDLTNITVRPSGGDKREEIGLGGGATKEFEYRGYAKELSGGFRYGLREADGAVPTHPKNPLIQMGTEQGKERSEYGPPLLAKQTTKSDDGYFNGVTAKPGDPKRENLFSFGIQLNRDDPKSPLPAANPPSLPAPPKKDDPKDSTPGKKPGEPGEPEPVVAKDKTEPPLDSGRKIIRTGEMEFEVESFDAAVDVVTKLIYAVKGGMKLKDDSDKQKNGKTRGFVVVRMPPEHLDKFVKDLRVALGKIGELKTQRIGSADVTKVYTDIASELRAARAFEKRLLDIIEKGKADLKDLIVAERELGLWRTKIEKMEGEIRYYDNQVALSTLTINLVEKDILTPSALVVNAKEQMRIEVDDVPKARLAAEKAVADLQGRLIKSDEKQHPAGQVEAIVIAEIPPAKKEAFRDILKKLGLVSAHEASQSQTTEGGSGRAIDVKARSNDVVFEVTLNNVVNIRPKNTVVIDLASTDVPGNYNTLRDAVLTQFKGQLRDGKLNEPDKQKVTAFLEFNVPTERRSEMDKLIAAAGPVLRRDNVQAAITDIATEQKFGYIVSLYSVATIAPREKVVLRLDDVHDVKKKAVELAELARLSKGQVNKPASGLTQQGQATAHLVMRVPLSANESLVSQFMKEGKVVAWNQTPNPKAPDNELATAEIDVTLLGGSPIVPSDEGLWNQIRSGLYMAFWVFSRCIVVVIIGIAGVLPWVLVIWIGYKVVCWSMGAGSGQQPAGSGTPATCEPQKPGGA